MQSDADIAAVARVIRQTYGARAASLMESRSKDYERAGAWGRAEFWGKVALMVRDFDLAENPTVGREPMDPAESKRSP